MMAALDSAVRADLRHPGWLASASRLALAVLAYGLVFSAARLAITASSGTLVTVEPYTAGNLKAVLPQARIVLTARDRRDNHRAPAALAARPQALDGHLGHAPPHARRAALPLEQVRFCRLRSNRENRAE